MNEYKKKQAAQTVQQNIESSAAPQKTNGIPNSVLNDVFAGKRRATNEMMGHKENLAPSIAVKMSRAFGMDLTGMQLYRSDKMSGTDMKGMSQGNTVVLSSDIDLNTGEGQAVLGHELSHIRAQSQGIGMGNSGLYNNAALEQQADREGLMAAHGRPIYESGMTENPGLSYGLGMAGVEGLTPLSGGISAGAGAPMQAKKDGDRKKNLNEAMVAAAGGKQLQKDQSMTGEEKEQMAKMLSTGEPDDGFLDPEIEEEGVNPFDLTLFMLERQRKINKPGGKEMMDQLWAIGNDAQNKVKDGLIPKSVFEEAKKKMIEATGG